MDMEQETAHYHGWSVALTDGQGIPDHIDAPSEQYNGIAHMIHTVCVNVSWCKTGSPRDICGQFRP